MGSGAFFWHFIMAETHTEKSEKFSGVYNFEEMLSFHEEAHHFLEITKVQVCMLSTFLGPFHYLKQESLSPPSFPLLVLRFLPDLLVTLPVLKLQQRSIYI